MIDTKAIRKWAQYHHQHVAAQTKVLASSKAPRAALADPAVETMSDDLRDRLVAISAAIADEDDRAAQAMIRELLSSPPPAAEVPLLTDEEMMEMVTANAGYGGTNFDRVARAIEQATRRKVGLA